MSLITDATSIQTLRLLSNNYSLLLNDHSYRKRRVWTTPIRYVWSSVKVDFSVLRWTANLPGLTSLLQLTSTLVCPYIHIYIHTWQKKYNCACLPVLGKMIQPAILVFLVFFITLGMYPGEIFKICPTNQTQFLHDPVRFSVIVVDVVAFCCSFWWWCCCNTVLYISPLYWHIGVFIIVTQQKTQWFSVLIVATFNFFDLIGRFTPAIKQMVIRHLVREVTVDACTLHKKCFSTLSLFLHFSIVSPH